MRNIVTGVISALTVAVLVPAVALAHVVVTPNQANVGEGLIFNVSVPNEKDSPVTMLKLAIPKGVSEVTPNVTPGWTIATEKSGDDVTAITWTGEIPSGQRQDFGFRAQVPATATQLDWKAYQTYGDGTTVHWDQTPAGDDDATGDAGPYSVTKVTNDLATTQPANQSNSSSALSLIFSIAALVLSIASLLIRRRR